ncbi:MAG: YerC/YecD family TrpR-related protein [Clostridia bacterium]|nr:YerC/YecD family TrpR-related protein [Clostridia bacterium]MDY4083237.1 YerC/YecD family TrpR-related protein [Eubacteriales bacterium]
MSSWHTQEVDELFKAITKLESVDECYKFFEDACTINEILGMAQRLKAAKLLLGGANYNDISAATGMSSATISRVNKCIEYGNGGYKIVLDRMEKE